jgi:hypothetical protein
MIRTQPIVVRSALREFWVAHTKGLRFGPALEQRFMVVNAPHRLRHILITGVVALVMFNSFLLSDWYMVPDVFDLALKWRLGIVRDGGWPTRRRGWLMPWACWAPCWSPSAWGWC